MAGISSPHFDARLMSMPMDLPFFSAESGIAAMNGWFEQQKAVFEALAPKAKATPKSKTSKQKAMPADLVESYRDFWMAFAKVMPSQAGAMDEGGIETLAGPAVRGHSAMAPSGAALPFGNGPTFATLFDGDRKSLKVYGAWLTLQQATLAQRLLVDTAWAEATLRFQEIVARPVSDENPAITSWSGGLNIWLSTVNKRLLELQRSDAFMQGQERLLAAVLDYRLKLRDMAEDICEMLQIPGRGEADQLAKTVHELRREVRRLSREVKSMNCKKEA
jgi:hypothetical protein